MVPSAEHDDFDLNAIAIAFDKEFDDGFAVFVFDGFEVVGFFVRDWRLENGDFVGKLVCARRLWQSLSSVT